MSCLVSASASRNSSPATNWSPRLIGFLFGGLQQADEVAADLDLLLTLHLGQFVHRRLGARQQARHVDAGALQQGAWAVFLPQHRHQQVGRLDIGVIVAQREGLRLAQGFLEFGGQFV